MEKAIVVDYLKNKKVVVYGLGRVSRSVIPYLKSFPNIQMLGATDSDAVCAEMRSIGGHKVLTCSINEWKEREPNATILIATLENYHAEIKQICKTAGFADVISADSYLRYIAQKDGVSNVYLDNLKNTIDDVPHHFQDKIEWKHGIECPKTEHVFFFVKTSALCCGDNDFSEITLCKQYLKEKHSDYLKFVVLLEDALIPVANECEEVDGFVVLSQRELLFWQEFALCSDNHCKLYPDGYTARQICVQYGIPDSFLKCNDIVEKKDYEFKAQYKELTGLELNKEIAKKLEEKIEWLIDEKENLDCQFHYYSMCASLGDITRTIPAVSVSKLYHKQYSVGEHRHIVMVEERYKDLIRSYVDVDGIICLDKKELLFWQDYAQKKISNFEVPNMYGPRDIAKRTLKACGIPESFIEQNQEYLRIPDGVREASLTKANKYLGQKNLEIDKVVIFVPCAGSSSAIDYENLNKVVNFYKELGYSVFTNAGYGEKLIEGTEIISEAADVVYALVQMGATIIGVQCGLMDGCEWMKFAAKRIKVSVLKTENDFVFYYNRKHTLERRIERRTTGAVIAVSKKDDAKQLSDDIIELSCYYLKGNIQKKCISNIRTTYYEYLRDMDKLSQYLKYLRDANDIVVLIASTGFKVTDEFEKVSLGELGITDIKGNENYLAVFDTEQGLLHEMRSNDLVNGEDYVFSIQDAEDYKQKWYNHCKDKLLKLRFPNETWGYIYSNAEDKIGYSRANIVLNGNEYSTNGEGLNFVIYSKTDACVIDCFYVKDMSELSIIRN